MQPGSVRQGVNRIVEFIGRQREVNCNFRDVYDIVTKKNTSTANRSVFDAVSYTRDDVTSTIAIRRINLNIFAVPHG